MYDYEVINCWGCGAEVHCGCQVECYYCGERGCRCCMVQDLETLEWTCMESGKNRTEQ